MSNVRARRRISSFQIIILGFAGVILLGALLLMLPVSTRSGAVTPFTDALFTSTSAVCVTGLVVRDTGSYWSTFGQSVIVLLIQIGGLGVITVAAAFSLLSGRKISLRQRSTMQDAISAPQVGGIVRLTRFVIIGTFTVELVGALLLMPSLCSQFGARGVWMSFFHAISAFCNAGFDLFGQGRRRVCFVDRICIERACKYRYNAVDSPRRPRIFDMGGYLHSSLACASLPHAEQGHSYCLGSAHIPARSAVFLLRFCR